MAAARDEFIDFLVAQGVLAFGEFTLKSGRVSPYFFNLGKIAGGTAFARLGEAYADAILAAEIEFDVLFGPAYKGIPIAVATATALAARGRDVGVAYNRKEAKDHGEGGSLVGADLHGRVLLIDDVLTSGKAIREAAALITSTPATICGAVIAMDRQERNDDGKTAVGSLADELGAPVISIANLEHLIGYLDDRASEFGTELQASVKSYQASYCT